MVTMSFEKYKEKYQNKVKELKKIAHGTKHEFETVNKEILDKMVEDNKFFDENYVLVRNVIHEARELNKGKDNFGKKSKSNRPKLSNNMKFNF